MRLILYIIGFLVLTLGLLLWVPMALAFFDQSADFQGFLWSSLLAIFLGAITVFFTRDAIDGANLSVKQAFSVVTLSWFSAGIIGSLPYYFGSLSDPIISAQFPTYIQCLFESISGFSTTGASILNDIESLPRGILFWRSLTHWLGGMGIVVLSIAILPLLGGGGMNLFKAEAPGTILPDKLSPRIAQTARSMWWVYILLTFIQMVLLLIAGMTFFDAICHAFATLATGGFSTKNSSIGHYDSDAIHWIITVFMFLAGLNFVHHYHMLKGNVTTYFKDSEARTYMGIVFTMIVIFVLFTLPLYQEQGLLHCIRDCAFQVCAIISSTGFGSPDYELWPPLVCFLIMLIMFVGGCTGSTAGGSKVMRIQILFKAGYRELKRLLHPHAVMPVRVGARSIPDAVVASVVGFFACVIVLLLSCSLAITAMNVDIETALTATISCVFNIGPGLGSVGPTENYSSIPNMGQFFLTICMVFGRLEVYTVLVMLIPEFYRK